MSPAVVQVRLDDAPRLDALFDRFDPALVTRLDAGDYRWRLDTPANPARAPQAWLCELAPGGDVVGYLDSAPVVLEAEGKSLRASWVMSLLVRPDFQSRGLPPWLVKAWAATTEACLAFGTTPDSRGLFERMGWRNLGTVSHYRLLLDPGPFLADRWRDWRGRLLDALSRPAAWALAPSPVKEGERVLGWALLGELDALWARIGPSLGVAVRRDAAYVTWRYRTRPEGDYELLGLRMAGRLEGVAVLRHRCKRGKVLGLLVDLWGDPAHLDLLLRHAVRRFSERGAHAVHVFTGHGVLGAALGRTGFRAVPTSLYLMCGVKPGLDTPAALQDPARWWVLQGDGDQDRLHVPSPGAAAPARA